MGLSSDEAFQDDNDDSQHIRQPHCSLQCSYFYLSPALVIDSLSVLVVDNGYCCDYYYYSHYN